MDEWDADGGATDQSNARPRCDTHNPFKSKRRLRSVRDPNGYIVDYRSDGTPMLPAGRRPPDALPDELPGDGTPADHHEIWDRLVANRTAVRSWDRRFHRMSLSTLTSTDELRRALSRSPEH